jgi:competence protein ComEC
MGDASKEQELDLLVKYNLQINLIKLGHHGSKTSSDYNFLKSIKVSKAIISAGRNNKFGHPNKETIKTLEDLNISCFNTQTLGTIKLKISRNGTYFYNFSP